MCLNYFSPRLLMFPTVNPALAADSDSWLERALPRSEGASSLLKVSVRIREEVSSLGRVERTVL